MAELDDTEKAILDFERAWWKYAAAKDTAIRANFGLSPTGYYKVLNALIDRPEAMAYDVMGVRRLRRLRTARQMQRSARRMSGVD